MKRCSFCGAVWSDQKTTCRDCGQRLGDPLPEEEAARLEQELSNKIEDLSDKAEWCYVSVADKVAAVLAFLCGIGYVGLFFLLRSRGEPVFGEMFVFAALLICCGLLLLFPRWEWINTRRYLSWYITLRGDEIPTDGYMVVRRIILYGFVLLGWILGIVALVDGGSTRHVYDTVYYAYCVIR